MSVNKLRLNLEEMLEIGSNSNLGSGDFLTLDGVAVPRNNQVRSLGALLDTAPLAAVARAAMLAVPSCEDSQVPLCRAGYKLMQPMQSHLGLVPWKRPAPLTSAGSQSSWTEGSSPGIRILMCV